MAATHGVFCGPAIERLKAAPIAGIVTTDSIPQEAGASLPNFEVLGTARLLGEAIKRIHQNESVSKLFD